MNQESYTLYQYGYTYSRDVDFILFCLYSSIKLTSVLYIHYQFIMKLVVECFVLKYNCFEIDILLRSS